MIAVLTLACFLVVCGWMIAEGYAKLLLVAVAVLVLGVLALTQRGAFIGILLLASMNGLPFIDTSPYVASKLNVEEVAMLALLLTAGAWTISAGRSHNPSRVARAVSHAGVLLLVWWLLTVVRTVIGLDIPIMRAAAFGRDFAFCALLLIILPRVRLQNRDLGVLLGVLTAGVCAFAVGQIMTATGIGHPGGLIHFERTLQESGLTRIYAHMTDMATAGLAVSVAACLAARRRTVRLIAAPVALLLMTSVVVQLTRARWIGLVAGIVLVSVWVMISGDVRLAARLRRRVALAIAVIAIAGIAAILSTPGIASGGTVIQRLLSAFTDLQTGGGTVAIREEVTRIMTAFLGDRWPLGLGFVPPVAHYYVGLPKGSIRDADLGVLNAVMTMGIVGATLIYLPVVVVLVNLLSRASARSVGEYSWLRYGGAVWIVATLVSSITLVTLFSASGLALTAVAMMILVHPSVLGELLPLAATQPELKRQPRVAQNEGGLATRRPGLPIKPDAWRDQPIS
jgi:hypothetical protein